MLCHPLGRSRKRETLCQFYHSEVEIPGTLDDIMRLTEEYVCRQAKTLLLYGREVILTITGDITHIEQLVQKNFS